MAYILTPIKYVAINGAALAANEKNTRLRVLRVFLIHPQFKPDNEIYYELYYIYYIMINHFKIVIFHSDCLVQCKVKEVLNKTRNLS